MGLDGCATHFGGIAALKQEAQALLAAFPASQKPADLPTDTPLDLERLSEGVLAKLCNVWFGPPDGRHVWGTEFHPPAEPPAPRCPAALFRVSRYVFGPHPSADVCRAGREAAPLAREVARAAEAGFASVARGGIPRAGFAVSGLRVLGRMHLATLAAAGHDLFDPRVPAQAPLAPARLALARLLGTW